MGGLMSEILDRFLSCLAELRVQFRQSVSGPGPLVPMPRAGQRGMIAARLVALYARESDRPAVAVWADELVRLLRRNIQKSLALDAMVMELRAAAGRSAVT